MICIRPLSTGMDSRSVIRAIRAARACKGAGIWPLYIHGELGKQSQTGAGQNNELDGTKIYLRSRCSPGRPFVRLPGRCDNGETLAGQH